jgi:hypothetical protein
MGQDGTDMLAREAREIFKDLIFGHPTGEVLEDIGRGDAGSEKRRLPVAPLRFWTENADMVRPAKAGAFSGR